MKIVLFTSSFPYGSGEQFLETEILFLAKKFTEVIVFPCTYGGAKSKRDTPFNVRVQSPIINSKIKRFSNLFFISVFKKKKHFYVFLSEFIRAIKTGNFKKFFLAFNMAYFCLNNANLKMTLESLDSSDVLYFYWGNGISNIIPFMEGIKGNIVLRLHRGDLYEELYNNYIPFRKEQLIKSDYIVPISENGLSYLLAKYPSLKDKILLFRLGVKHNKCLNKKNSNFFHLVSCSSLIPVKRVELIVEILENINDKNIKWTHIGNGFLMREIESRIEKLSDNIQVELKGFMDNKKVLEFYRNTWIDFFINVSESEGVPVSIMEVSSFGVPSIATNVGGTSEIVNKDTGFLLDKYFSPESVSVLLEEIISGKKTVSRKKVLDKWMREFNADINYENFTDFLLSLEKNDNDLDELKA